MCEIYTLCVKFSGLKLWLCKKSDKYEVCFNRERGIWNQKMASGKK